MSRRQHAPNKPCALSNDVRLITRFYGMCIRVASSIVAWIWPWQQHHSNPQLFNVPLCTQSVHSNICSCQKCDVWSKNGLASEAISKHLILKNFPRGMPLDPLAAVGLHIHLLLSLPPDLKYLLVLLHTLHDRSVCLCTPLFL